MDGNIKDLEVNMSKAREEYYKMYSRVPASFREIKMTNYIKELEESLEQLAEKHDKLHTEYIELKSQNEEMLIKFVDLYKLNLGEYYMSSIYHNAIERFIEKITGKSIDEVLKDE